MLENEIESNKIEEEMMLILKRLFQEEDKNELFFHQKWTY